MLATNKTYMHFKEGSGQKAVKTVFDEKMMKIYTEYIQHTLAFSVQVHFPWWSELSQNNVVERSIVSFSAISTGAALIIYPVAMESNNSSSAHQYGPGYGLGWGSAFFFLAAAFCMSLDDLVRESSKAKICRLCFKSRQGDRREQSVWHHFRNI